MASKKTASDNVVSLQDARWAKNLEDKEEKLDNMAKRFEEAMPAKATPVKDFLKKKRKNKKKK